MAFAVALICLPNELSGFGGGTFSCFDFLISRLPRLFSLGMAERPFDEGCAVAGLRHADRLEIILRRHPFVTFAVIADSILRRISPRRERASDVIDLCGSGWPALQSDSLSDRKEMRRGVAANGTSLALLDVCSGHDCWWSFSSAASRSAGLIGIISCVARCVPIAGRWMKAPTRRQASRDIPSIASSSWSIR